MNAKSRRSPHGGRYKRRSSSREQRPRTRTYGDHHSESYDSEYSDDFEPDARSKDPPPRRRRGSPRRKTYPYSSDQSSTSHVTLHSVRSKKSAQSSVKSYMKKSMPKRGWRSQNHSKSEHVRTRHDTITSRLLSAKQRKINEIQNDLAETEHRLESVLKENKLLNTVQHRQDKALRRFQDVESDLPRLISQNFEDQKVLKTRLKKAQEGERILEDKLQENNDEMQKMERILRKLKKVVYDKNLGERSELARQLTNTENNLTVAERKVKEMEKKLELTTSSFTRQIKSERQKHKEMKEKLDALLEDYQSIVTKLKEKERALGVSNIYALRNKESSFTKSPRRTTEVLTAATQTEALLAISNQEEPEQRESPSVVEFKSSRSRKKREHVEKKSVKADRSEESPRGLSPALFSHKPEPPKKSASVMVNGHHSAINQGQREKDTVFLTAKFQSNSPSSNNSLAGDSIDFEKVESAPDQRLGGISPLRSNVRKIEEPGPFEEAEKQNQLEVERAKLAEQQKKKAELLTKMREIEGNDSTTSPLSPVLSPTQVTSPLPLVTEKSSSKSNSFISNPKSKAELVKSLLGTDSDPVVENLHLGLPSNAKNAAGKPEREISFGGYAPSVGTTQASRKPLVSDKPHKATSSDSDNDEPLLDLNSGKQAKKADFLSQLFGDEPKNNQDSGGNASKIGESVTPRAKPVHSGYPWEKNVVASTHVNGTANHVPNKVKTGLSLNASGPIQEDDIEELTL